MSTDDLTSVDSRIVDTFVAENMWLMEMWKHIDMKAQSTAVVAGILLAALSLSLRTGLPIESEPMALGIILGTGACLTLAVFFAVLAQLARRLCGPMTGRTALNVWKEHGSDVSVDAGVRTRTVIAMWMRMNEAVRSGVNCKGTYLSIAQWFVVVGAVGVAVTFYCLQSAV